MGNPFMPRFYRASKALINSEVNVKEVGTGSLTVSNLKAGIFPASAFEDVVVMGRYTDATMFMFCKAFDKYGEKLDIQKEYTIEEIDTPNRVWLVTNDPENFNNVYLLVPLRSHFSVS